MTKKMMTVRNTVLASATLLALSAAPALAAGGGGGAPQSLIEQSQPGQAQANFYAQGPSGIDVLLGWFRGTGGNNAAVAQSQPDGGQYYQGSVQHRVNG